MGIESDNYGDNYYDEQSIDTTLDIEKINDFFYKNLPFIQNYLDNKGRLLKGNNLYWVQNSVNVQKKSLLKIFICHILTIDQSEFLLIL